MPVGDLYLLKFIPYDWDDERSVAILRTIRRHIPQRGRLAIIETVLSETDPGHVGWLADLNMLAMTGGRERTLGEFTELLSRAGFRRQRVTATESPLGVIEAVPDRPVS